MHATLADLLEKKGIKDLSELSSEEKAKFDSWNAILSEGEISINTIANFCKNQMKMLEAQWRRTDIDAARKGEFIPYYTAYSVIYDLITQPRAERDNLLKFLNNQIESLPGKNGSDTV